MRGAVDPYLRILVALSLVVVVADAAGVPVLPHVFPAVAVLVAVGGAAAAAAAAEPASGRRALTALLLPFWLFAAAVLAVMLTLGWPADPDQGAAPFTWSTAWLWLVPLSDPPASLDGIPWVATAWYAPTFLWLALATPALLWLFRRWPLRLLLLPVVTMLALTTGVATVTGRSRDVLVEVCVHACCWLVGFARHDGRLVRWSPVAASTAGVLLVGSGLAYAAWRHEVYEAGRIGDIPLAALLCSLGVVLLLFRVPWRGERLRAGAPGAALSAVGARAVTVFLWAPVAAAAATPALARSPLAAFHTDDAPGTLLRYAATGVLVLAAVLLFGWAEDVAASRPPTLLGARRPARPAPRGVPSPIPAQRSHVVPVRDVTSGGAPEPAVPGAPRR